MTKNQFIAWVTAGSVFMLGCGEASTPETNTEDRPTAAVKVDSSARGFLQHEETELLAACASSTAAERGAKNPPTTTKEGPTMNGFVPIVGPDCATGYLATAATASARGAELPLGVEAVREGPSTSAVVVGYVIPGSIGWVAADEIALSGFSFADLVVAASEIQADRERRREADPAG